MRFLLSLAAVLFILFSSLSAAEPVNEVIKIKANPRLGFYWDYYLYLPYNKISPDDSISIMVFPNNSGKVNDTIEFHDRKALRSLNNNRDFGDQLGVVLLEPVFPRPQSEAMLYTHALDRDAMTTGIENIKRLDLQLIAMIENSRQILKSKNIIAKDKILMFGFSAAGMFTNRFVLLHPELVEAAAIGSPGGWPIVPVAEYEGQTLRYPVGIADLELLNGRKLNSEAFRKVRLFFFLGDEDENDSVIYDDSYDEEDRVVIMNLFGATPVARWPIAEKLYMSTTDNCQFKLYPDIGHSIRGQMWQDIKAFLKDEF